jgi:hypothetical protein
MPPRIITLGIIAFWMTMTGWTLYKDVWPRVQPDSPPPFTVDLMDEAQLQGPNHIIWRLSTNGQPGIFHLETWVQFLPKEDLFELHGNMWPVVDREGHISELALMSMLSTMTVNREGELKSLEMKLMPPVPLPIPTNLVVEPRIVLMGLVKDGSLVPRIQAPEKGFDRTFDPIPIKTRGSILNPLQPLNRLPNLKRGQKWRMPVVDPVSQAFGSLAPLSSGYVRTFEAEVLHDVKSLRWRDEDVACLVIEYSGDDASGSTWVRKADGLVLQQEVTLSGKTLNLLRDQ